MEEKYIEIQRVYQSVWAFRERYGQYWTTPTPIESARYAYMEMGEVLDAEMRLANPHHNRRTVKDISLSEELADVAIMSCSVLPPEFAAKIAGPGKAADGKVHSLDELAVLIARLYEAAMGVGGDEAETDGYGAIADMVSIVMQGISQVLANMDAPALDKVVAGKLLVIYRKRISHLLN